MSQRTLIEINHDYTGVIDLATTGAFEAAMLRYLRSADSETARELEKYGIRVFGRRHHSDGFSIEWGSKKISEAKSSRG